MIYKSNGKINTGGVSVIVAWGITAVALIWQVAVKDSQYALEIENIKSELTTIDKRLNQNEAFKLEISSDLAEIKTDLLWIRQQLMQNSSIISEALRKVK
tara:strand:- start:196 stop:495 length:300 start_codon:yes stop_codon:yes gene_type:complete